jgi:hypothetical protein
VGVRAGAARGERASDPNHTTFLLSAHHEQKALEELPFNGERGERTEA